MAQKLEFDLQSANKSPEHLATTRRDAMTAAKVFGPLRLDGESCIALGYGVVASAYKVDGEYLIVELDSVDEAIAFVAEANGQTEADVLATARANAEYLQDLRTRKRAPTKGSEEDGRE